MKIVRDGKEIELTEDEVFNTYLEQEHLFDVELVKGNMEGYLEDGEYEKLKDNVDFIETTANLFRQKKDEGLYYEFALGEAFAEAQKEFIEKGM